MTTITTCFTARASTSRYSTHLAGVSYLRAYKTKAFLKRKKGWKSGRTVIAYDKVVHRRLLKAVAILLGELANDTWSDWAVLCLVLLRLGFWLSFLWEL